MDLRRLQLKLDKLVNAATFDIFRDALANLSVVETLPEADDSFGGIKTYDLAQERNRSMARGSALACLCANHSATHRRYLPAITCQYHDGF